MAEGWAHLKQLPEILLYGLSSQKLSGYSCVLHRSSRAPVENVLWERSRGGQSFACSENATASLPPYESNLKSEKVKVKSLSRVQLFATQWTVAYQSPQSMEFSRQECWSGLPFPSPGDLLHPWIEPGSPAAGSRFTVWATRKAISAPSQIQGRVLWTSSFNRESQMVHGLLKSTIDMLLLMFRCDASFSNFTLLLILFSM